MGEQWKKLDANVSIILNKKNISKKHKQYHHLLCPKALCLDYIHLLSSTRGFAKKIAFASKSLA